MGAANMQNATDQEMVQAYARSGLFETGFTYSQALQIDLLKTALNCSAINHRRLMQQSAAIHASAARETP
jgi:hypothetical protein